MDNCEGNVLASSEAAGIKTAEITHDGLTESQIPPPHNQLIMLFL